MSRDWSETEFMDVDGFRWAFATCPICLALILGDNMDRHIKQHEEVAALREHIRREVLADPRAKVEGLRERADAHTEECPGRPGYRGICTCEGDILISRAAVLALFDEGSPK